MFILILIGMTVNRVRYRFVHGLDATYSQHGVQFTLSDFGYWEYPYDDQHYKYSSFHCVST